MRAVLVWIIGLVMAVALPLGTISAAPAAPQRKPDLADSVAGTYYGDIISDARGSSKTGVTITVTRIARNEVAISCDCQRIPKVQIPIERVMDAILASDGPYVFLIEMQKDPRRLGLTIDDASLSVVKQ